MKYNYHELNDEYCLQFEYNNKSYLLSTSKDLLIINGNCYKLIENGLYYEYEYKIQKTQVNCRSKQKLFKHFLLCLRENFALETWTIQPIENILKNCKQVKA